jgi:hypothetical protein
MKRTPLRRKIRLKPVNPKRAKARKARDFGPYADWIRQRVCIVEGSVWHHYQVYQRVPGPAYWTEAAHVRSRGAGGRAEGNLVPLCVMHHREQHEDGIQSFQARYGLDLRAIAASLWATYQAQTEGTA